MKDDPSYWHIAVRGPKTPGRYEVHLGQGHFSEATWNGVVWLISGLPVEVRAWRPCAPSDEDRSAAADTSKNSSSDSG